MKIGIVTDNYFPSVGGTEISIRNYAKKLEELGHEVFIFCPNLGLKNPKRERKNIIRLKSIRRIYADHPLMFVHPGITKKFREYDLDILHSQTPVTAPYVAEHVARKLDIPHIHTMHTLIPEQVKRWRTGIGRMSFLYGMQSLILRSFRPPERYLKVDEKGSLAIKVRLCWAYMVRLVNVPDKVIFPGRAVCNIFKSRGFTNQAFLLPTFSNMFLGAKKSRHLSDNEGPVRIIHVGRLDVEKRVHVLIEAVNLLPDYLDWELVIVGNGNQRARLKRLVRKYKLQDRVSFRGTLSQNKVAEELVESDLFVMTSYRFDTQGIVLLEAAAAALPIVYCDDHLTVGVEKKNSILTMPFAWSMSQAIEKLIEDKDLRRKMAEASLAVEKKYEPTKLTRRLVSFYRKTINDYNNQKD